MGVQTQPVSRLPTLVRAVLYAIGATGDATPLPVGREYLTNLGVGTGPRAVFVPAPRGKWTTVGIKSAGYVATVARGCDVYVRGVENGDDVTRTEAAEALADRIINALRATAPGYIEGGDFREVDPTDPDAFGAELILSFTFTRGVAKDIEIWAAPIVSVSPPDRDRPQGDNGYNYTVEAPVEGSR